MSEMNTRRKYIHNILTYSWRSTGQRRKLVRVKDRVVQCRPKQKKKQFKIIGWALQIERNKIVFWECSFAYRFFCELLNFFRPVFFVTELLSYERNAIRSVLNESQSNFLSLAPDVIEPLYKEKNGVLSGKLSVYRYKRGERKWTTESLKHPRVIAKKKLFFNCHFNQ